MSLDLIFVSTINGRLEFLVSCERNVLIDRGCYIFYSTLNLLVVDKIGFRMGVRCLVMFYSMPLACCCRLITGNKFVLKMSSRV